jgi:heme-degrading monooxygenase HmoA
MPSRLGDDPSDKALSSSGEINAEPPVAGAGIRAFHGMKPLQSAPLLNCIVRRGGVQRGAGVYIVVWAFRPRPGREGEFERVYGPQGRWAALFREAPGYLSTDLLRAQDGSGRYLTVDRWQSRAAYEEFLKCHGSAYQALDQACEVLSESEERLGDFLVVESPPDPG